MTAMLGFGSSDAFWYVVAGAAVALGAALVYWFRRSVRWLALRSKVAFTEWFGEAVDEHVEPKFSQLRDETTAVAADVKDELRRHTEDEGELVRAVVRSEIAPILEQLESHVVHDDRVMAAAGDALVKGQADLMRQINTHHQESMDTIDQHVKDDAAAFKRIEDKLEAP